MILAILIMIISHTSDHNSLINFSTNIKLGYYQFIVRLITIPDAPRMEYLPTFTPRMTQM